MSNGILHRRYSKVAPMQMLCPFKGVIPAAIMAVSSALKNFAHVSGVKSNHEQYAKRSTVAYRKYSSVDCVAVN